MLDNDNATEIDMNFKVPRDFYMMYKESSETNNKTMKTILIESFKLWVENNGFNGKQ